MTQLLIEPARRTGCEDIPALTEVLQSAAQRQRSPIDDVLDAGRGRRGTLHARTRARPRAWSGWTASRCRKFRCRCARPAARGSRCATACCRSQITGEGDHKRLKLATFDPFNLVARQAAAQELELPIDWCMASRKRLHEALRRLYGVGADTFEQILEGRDFDYDAHRSPARTRRTSSTRTTTRRPASSSSSTRSSARRSTSARPTSTSSRWPPTCASATGSTAA